MAGVALAVGTAIRAVVVGFGVVAKVTSSLYALPCLLLVALTFHFVCMSYHTPEKTKDSPHLV